MGTGHFEANSANGESMSLAPLPSCLVITDTPSVPESGKVSSCVHWHTLSAWVSQDEKGSYNLCIHVITGTTLGTWVRQGENRWLSPLSSCDHWHTFSAWVSQDESRCCLHVITGTTLGTWVRQGENRWSIPLPHVVTSTTLGTWVRQGDNTSLAPLSYDCETITYLSWCQYLQCQGERTCSVSQSVSPRLTHQLTHTIIDLAWSQCLQCQCERHVDSLDQLVIDSHIIDLAPSQYLQCQCERHVDSLDQLVIDTHAPAHPCINAVVTNPERWSATANSKE